VGGVKVGLLLLLLLLLLLPPPPPLTFPPIHQRAPKSRSAAAGNKPCCDSGWGWVGDREITGTHSFYFARDCNLACCKHGCGVVQCAQQQQLLAIAFAKCCCWRRRLACICMCCALRLQVLPNWLGVGVM